jgi:hypothetical protein
VVSIQGRRMHLWRAVDSQGKILDMLVQPRWDKTAALRLMRKLLKRHCHIKLLSLASTVLLLRAGLCDFNRLGQPGSGTNWPLVA